jgi:hypothetical protein
MDAYGTGFAVVLCVYGTLAAGFVYGLYYLTKYFERRFIDREGDKSENSEKDYGQRDGG